MGKLINNIDVIFDEVLPFSFSKRESEVMDELIKDTRNQYGTTCFLLFKINQK